MNPYTTKIIRELEKVSAIGADNNTTFDDWLEITLATLEALPAHMKAARQTGRLAEDTEETKKLWERLRVRYHKPYC
jgi:hypothetical protein